MVGWGWGAGLVRLSRCAAKINENMPGKNGFGDGGKAGFEITIPYRAILSDLRAFRDWSMSA